MFKLFYENDIAKTNIYSLIYEITIYVYKSQIKYI